MGWDGVAGQAPVRTARGYGGVAAAPGEDRGGRPARVRPDSA